MQSVHNVKPAWCLFEGVRCGDTPGNENCAHVNSISLPHLGLSGTLPASIGDFLRLTHFDVSHNHLSGTIPGSVSNWHAGLRELRLSNNMFTGFIPLSIGACRALAVLTLDSNKLTGTIPSSIYDLASLKRLDLDKNSLTGPNPTQMFKSTQLISLPLKSNYLTKGSANIVPESFFSEEIKQSTLLPRDKSITDEAILLQNQEGSATRCPTAKTTLTRKC